MTQNFFLHTFCLPPYELSISFAFTHVSIYIHIVNDRDLGQRKWKLCMGMVLVCICGLLVIVCAFVYLCVLVFFSTGFVYVHQRLSQWAVYIIYGNHATQKILCTIMLCMCSNPRSHTACGLISFMTMLLLAII